MTFKHISSSPEILRGNPCIADTRISVDFILQLIASGANAQNIVERYGHLSLDTVKEALIYASEVLKNEIVIEIKSVA